MLESLRRVREFLLHGLWREIPVSSRFRAFELHVIRIVTVAARGFVNDHCTMRATALSYTTLLSLVPLLAFAFAILKGMGVQDRLRPVIERLAAGQSDVVEQILIYIERTPVNALGAAGLVFLIYTTVSVLSTIEASFNEIWAVRRSRTVFRKFTDYVSVLVTSPILLLVGMSAVAVLNSAWVREFFLLGLASHVALLLAPFVGVWVAFAAVYIFMPNTRVRVWSALVGGIVAGTSWQVAFWGYTKFQIGMARYNAIYGTFAAVPIFMIWVYVSWVIMLFGAELAWATQNLGHVWEEQRCEGATCAVREAVALRAMTCIAAAFQREGRAVTVGEIAQRLQVPSLLVLEEVRVLAAHGLCIEVARKDDPAYQPARPLEKITPAQVVEAVRTDGNPIALSEGTPEAVALGDILHALGDPRRAGLGDLTLRDVVARFDDEKPT